MNYALFEDETSRNFLPLTHFRAVHDLVCGALTLREKWALSLGPKKVFEIVRPALRAVDRDPGVALPGPPPAGPVWLINSRVVPDPVIRALLGKKPSGPVRFMSGGSVVAAWLDALTAGEVLRAADSAGTDAAGAGSAGISPALLKLPAADCSPTILEHLWDIIPLTAAEISADFTLLDGKKPREKDHPGAHFVNRKQILVGKKVRIGPGAVIDASDGPVAIGDGAVVMPNAVIIGPAWIGPKALIKVGAKIYGGSSIGRHSKAGGEIEGSVIMPFTNKAHEGFLGHSYLGSWVNLGADTNTSDLKNTYGPVKAWSDGTLLDTGLQFLGLMMGDHSKSGINVMFDTGTVAGVCCNLYGAGLPPKQVPSFSWGEPGRYATYRVDDCIGTMKRVMARRNVEPDEAYLGLVRSVFNSTAAERDRSR